MMRPHEFQRLVSFVDHSFAQFENRSVVLKNHRALKEGGGAGRGNSEIHGESLRGIFFDPIAPRKQSDLTVLPELRTFVLGGKVSRNGKQFLPSTLIEIREMPFPQLNRGKYWPQRLQTQRCAQEKFSIRGLVKEFVDICAFVGHNRDAQSLIFQAYTAQTMKTELPDPAPKIAVTHVRYVAGTIGATGH